MVEEMQSPWKMVRLFIHTVRKISRSHGIFDVQWNFWHLMESFTSWIFYLSKHAQYYTTYKVMIVTQFPYIVSLCPYFHIRVLSSSILEKNNQPRKGSSWWNKKGPLQRISVYVIEKGAMFKYICYREYTVLQRVRQAQFVEKKGVPKRPQCTMLLLEELGKCPL